MATFFAGVCCTPIAEAQQIPLAQRTPYSQDQDVDRFRLSKAQSAQPETLFELLDPESTGISFQVEYPDPKTYLKEYMLLSIYGGICTGDFDNDGLADFFVTSPVGGGRLYRNLGDFHFEDITQEAGLSLESNFWGTGATFADVNNDGWLDLYVCSYQSANKLFINGGETAKGRRFAEQARKFGLDYRGSSTTMCFADFDNDGDLDGYLATTALPPPPGTKFQVRFENGKPVVLDELREYWQLIYLPGKRATRTEAGQYDHFFRNDGDHFTEITKEAGIDGPYFTLSATCWDYNRDGLPDIYVSNDFMGPDLLYENQGDGTFRDVIRDVIPHTPWFSMGSDIGDLNQDGLIDLFATDMSATTHFRRNLMLGTMEESTWFLDFAEPRQYMRNALYLNSGSGRFMEAAYLAGLADTDWTWTPRLADLDCDGDLDIFITNGALRDTMNADASNYSRKRLGEGSQAWADYWAKQPLRLEKNLAYRNEGNLNFIRVEEEWGLGKLSTSFGAATADFDNDGDLDIVISNADSPVSLYRNNSSTGGRLSLKLHGNQSNHFGLGATATIRYAGKQQTKYLTLARGWLSACEPVLQFGLGDVDQVDELKIDWPSGQTQIIKNIDANTLCLVKEPATSQPAARHNAPLETQTWFSEAKDLIQVIHQEDSYDDFKQQPLLPKRLSTAGPAVAWGDVNADGRGGFYFGGSRGVSGAIWSADPKSGGIRQSSTKAFEADAESEDVAAVFFDADGDGDTDLYVVSGGNEAEVGDATYQDRLYWNQGNGNFEKADAGVLPSSSLSGSCVAPCDIDSDGDLDLFVGTRCVPGSYPKSAPSQLLVNEGGVFVDKTPPELSQLGLVVDAEWVDVDADQQKDLLVATEWGPVKLFLNRHGVFHEVTQAAGLSNLSGWWTTVATGDFDQDGDLDFIAGNVGLNTKYHASQTHPEVLYYGSIESHRQPSIIEAYFENNICYPRRSMGDLRDVFPLLDQPESYEAFASSSLSELFGQDLLESFLRLEVIELRSGVFLNDGAAHFTFQPLPRLAQIAPLMSVGVSDWDGDGNLDLALGQNFFGPSGQTGRWDGGIGLILRGDGKGRFTVLPPAESGISMSGEVRHVIAADLNSDNLIDLFFARNNDPVLAYLRNSSTDRSRTSE